MMTAHARYRETQVAEATPQEILIGTYDGMLQRIARARQAILDRDPAEKGMALSPVFVALGELRVALEHQRAPQLCARLDALYDYLGRRLQLASCNRDITILDEVSKHLRDLRATWAQAFHSVKPAAAR
jgi:flagellar protein FliS